MVISLEETFFDNKKERRQEDFPSFSFSRERRPAEVRRTLRPLPTRMPRTPRRRRR